ncbi:helix-turn-helix domain-containing protein [Moorena sp. SIO3I6]|nr:helix-turn-helix domain-containing protein [Moorena sp. SIO3I6]
MATIINYCYRIYPDSNQEQTMLHWLEISRQVYNYSFARNQRLGEFAQM